MTERKASAGLGTRTWVGAVGLLVSLGASVGATPIGIGEGDGPRALSSIAHPLRQDASQAGSRRTKTRPPIAHESISPSPPWLVTVIHRISVRDLMQQWRQQGIYVSALDGSAHSQITNIASGLVVDERGQILVRLAHGVPDRPDADLWVVTSDGRARRPTVVAYDEATGYALLEVPALGIAPPPFVLGSFSAPEAPVRIIAGVPKRSPAPTASDVLTPSSRAASPSEVSRTTRSELSISWRQLLPMRIQWAQARLKIDAARERADRLGSLVVEMPEAEWSADGSVILTERGEVIGVAEDPSPRGYTVRSAASLRTLIEKLGARIREKSRRVNQPVRPSASGWIGIRAANTADLTEAERAALAPLSEGHVVAVEVIPGSPADRAGVRPGDMILRYRDHEVTSVEALAEMIAQTPIGLAVPVTIRRKEAIHQLFIPIEKRPEDASTRIERTETRPERTEPPLRWTPARLGIRTMDLTEQLADFFGARERQGVLILEVAPESPAASSGMRAGDVIVALGDQPVRTRSDLMRALSTLSSGTTRVLLIRHRELVTLTLSLRPESR